MKDTSRSRQTCPAIDLNYQLQVELQAKIARSGMTESSVALEKAVLHRDSIGNTESQEWGEKGKVEREATDDAHVLGV
ncbi:hypothetical protein N7468_008809 [Penicillium chermesinum]|uniref:Uncharacterized protein n=1 Tax=Penicillium chermesinum TaxID=63820 RepID=A0A9W9TFI2_9EURO|nr:uncharacterized protein N7468_008809 [Penicillium chermesinum]KAJ5219605.1 hypothetical protein N7468_008809 [Penicillium chermesinum]KAJ6153616.1 hypothetical protein N7470_006575 [Penicillium chermesinum]